MDKLQRKWRFDYVEILAIGHGVQFSNFNKHLITKQITLPILYLSGCFSSLNEDQLAKLDISILEDEIQLIIMNIGCSIHSSSTTNPRYYESMIASSSFLFFLRTKKKIRLFVSDP